MHIVVLGPKEFTDRGQDGILQGMDQIHSKTVIEKYSGISTVHVYHISRSSFSSKEKMPLHRKIVKHEYSISNSPFQNVLYLTH